MNTEDMELKAISIMLKELEQLPEERKLPALKYVIERLKLPGSSVISEKKKDSPENEQTMQTNQNFDNMSIQEFIDAKRPKNNYQLIACLTYYLEKKEQITEVGTLEIREANSRARLPAIANLARDIQNTQYQYQFIMQASEGKKKLTTHGEKIVEVLPDQEKVMSIIKEVRTKIRRKQTKKEDSTK